jgi:hypothetical protein
MYIPSEVDKLSKALSEFQSEVGNVAKDGVNPFFKSKYASLENVITTVKPLLAKHGLSYSQFPDGDGLTTILLHESGQHLQATANLHFKDQTPQGQGSAITYMRRYALSSILGIATEDDDDGNAASPAAKAVTKMLAAPAKPAAPKSIINEQKKAIADLLKATVAADPTNLFEEPSTAEEYAETCLQYTGLALEEKNFTAIIKKLTK